MISSSQVCEVVSFLKEGPCLRQPPPEVLHVCRESRDVSISLYQPLFKQSASSIKSLIRIDTDTLYISRHRFETSDGYSQGAILAIQNLLKSLHPDSRWNIKHLAVNYEALSPADLLAPPAAYFRLDSLDFLRLMHLESFTLIVSEEIVSKTKDLALTRGKEAMKHSLNEKKRYYAIRLHNGPTSEVSYGSLRLVLSMDWQSVHRQASEAINNQNVDLNLRDAKIINLTRATRRYLVELGSVLLSKLCENLC